MTWTPFKTVSAVSCSYRWSISNSSAHSSSRWLSTSPGEGSTSSYFGCTKEKKNLPRLELVHFFFHFYRVSWTECYNFCSIARFAMSSPAPSSWFAGRALDNLWSTGQSGTENWWASTSPVQIRLERDTEFVSLGTKIEQHCQFNACGTAEKI